MKELIAADNALSSLAPFESLSTLKLLDVSNNYIESISRLPQSLVVLNLQNNPLDSKLQHSGPHTTFLCQLKIVNVHQISSVSCFQNFKTIAYGPAPEEIASHNPTQ